MRLGVYADLVYRSDGETLSADRAFVNFVTGLPPRVSELVLFGRDTSRIPRRYFDPEAGTVREALPTM